MEFVAGSAPEKIASFPSSKSVYSLSSCFVRQRKGNGTKSTKNSTTNENQQIVFCTHNLSANKFKTEHL